MCSRSAGPATKPRAWFLETPSRHIWDAKYRYRRGETCLDADVDASWRRIAKAIAAAESRERGGWARQFYAILKGFRFLPGGRIQAGAGTGRRVTLLNCFVMGIPEDSIEDIFRQLGETAVTMQQGGGIGCDFSALRPRGSLAMQGGGIASGPVSFMEIWDAMCGTILSTGARRGAMMATLRCDHPDIEEFIDAKRKPDRLRRFNLSVLLSDAFLHAAERDELWPLVFPAEVFEGSGESLQRSWSGKPGPVPCRVVRRVSARALWDRIVRAAFDSDEPGVLFVDRINRCNNLRYCETISAANPCGEVPLPPYGGCDLGSLNLTSFVREPFRERARIDLPALRASARVATRFLDNVIDVSQYPLAAQRDAVRRTRRIGLGITGLGDTLAMLGLHYDSDAARRSASDWMREVTLASYRSSIELARERGAFPAFARDAYLAAPFVAALPSDIRDGIARCGIRNSHLLAIAPTGTVSLLANNVSSGLEPIFALRQRRSVLDFDGRPRHAALVDYAFRRWLRTLGPPAPVPAALVEARELTPRAHLAMQAALQPLVDNAISKTVNVPTEIAYEDFEAIYRQAYELGLKGFTTFRARPGHQTVLESEGGERALPHCCIPEREAD